MASLASDCFTLAKISLLGFTNTYHMATRTPIPASAALTWVALEEGLSNTTGIVTRSLVELQRLIVCGNASTPVHIDNAWKKRIAAVVASNASARVTLVSKSNACIRTDHWVCLTARASVVDIDSVFVCFCNRVGQLKIDPTKSEPQTWATHQEPLGHCNRVGQDCFGCQIRFAGS